MVRLKPPSGPRYGNDGMINREFLLLTLFKYPSIESLARHLTEEPANQPPTDDLKERAKKQKEVLQRRTQRNRKSLRS